MTREDWLLLMTNMLRPAFAEAGATLPAHLRVSCGWTSSRALSANRAIGECWPSACSADQARELFISPCIQEGVVVGATLVHELVHAALDCQHGHKGPFRKLAVKLGLEGKI